MIRNSATLLVVVLLMGFGIFFGVELATRGMERIQGPADGYVRATEPAPVRQQTPVRPPVETKPAVREEPVQTADSGVNRLGNKIGDLLQIMAHHTISTVVSVFDGIVE